MDSLMLEAVAVATAQRGALHVAGGLGVGLVSPECTGSWCSGPGPFADEGCGVWGG